MHFNYHFIGGGKNQSLKKLELNKKHYCLYFQLSLNIENIQVNF